MQFKAQTVVELTKSELHFFQMLPVSPNQWLYLVGERH